MTDDEPGGSAPGSPARLPGPVPTGYLPREWVQQVPLPPPTAGSDAAAGPPTGSDAAAGPPTADGGPLGSSGPNTWPPPSPVTAPPPPVVDDVPFLDTPWVPPRTKREGFLWLVYAAAGFVVGQLGAVLFSFVAALVAGKSTAQLRTIAGESVPPEWYVISTLIGLWVGFIGAPWLASRTQGTRNFLRDFGLRFRLIDLVGIAIGIGGQVLVVLMYAPFQRHIHDFNAPSHRLTGGSHGVGFAVIAVFTVLLAPAMEELFFRGLLLKALVRLLAPLRPAGVTGGARTVAVVAAVVLDGLLFGLAHGEWVQLAGLATFGAILAAVSYRTGRLGMNMVAHATFNLVAIVVIASNGTALIH